MKKNYSTPSVTDVCQVRLCTSILVISDVNDNVSDADPLGKIRHGRMSSGMTDDEDIPEPSYFMETMHLDNKPQW